MRWQYIYYVLYVSFILIFFQSCSSSVSDVSDEWNIDSLYEVNLLSKTEYSDTIELQYNDDSYLFFDEYSKWQSDYFIWLNKSKFKTDKIYTIKSILKTDEIKSFTYSYDDITGIVEIYEANKNFVDLTYDIFNTLSRIEVRNLLIANSVVAERKKESYIQFSDVLYDYIDCTDTCDASKRLQFLAMMINEVKLEHMWHKELRVEPCRLIQWINNIPNDLVYEEERSYCEHNLLDRSLEVLKHIQKGETEDIKSEFYSNNYYESISQKDAIFTLYKDGTKNLVLENFERIQVVEEKIKTLNKYIKEDSLDLVSLHLPMSIKQNTGDPKYILVQSYAYVGDEYKLVSLFVYDPSETLPNNLQTI